VIHLLLIFPLFVLQARDTDLTLQISRIADGFYVHTSNKKLGDRVYPSNGLVVEAEDGVVVIDTPWDTIQSVQLLEWIKVNLKKKVLCCIVTHAHADRIGGIAIFKQRGINVLSTPLTAERAGQRGFLEPEPALPNDTLLTWGNVTAECFFPGKGHTDDNIVVWFPGERILFGGCLVKSGSATGLGNIADADLLAWPVSIYRVMRKFPDHRIVVPGHEDWEDNNSLEHTLGLLKNAK
jgi:metallo-beta-lactamase class B